MAEGTRLTILVVDDDERIVAIASEMLAILGYQVIKAFRPEQAITLFEEHDGEVDLLLTDVLMPGLSGPELAEVLRERKPSLQVLMMTGYAGRFRGADDLIEKPFGLTELQGRVAQILDASSALRSPRR